MKGYPLKELYEEMAFVAYYFHWPWVEIMQLPHGERRRWCEEIRGSTMISMAIGRTSLTSSGQRYR